MATVSLKNSRFVCLKIIWLLIAFSEAVVMRLLRVKKQQMVIIDFSADGLDGPIA